MRQPAVSSDRRVHAHRHPDGECQKRRHDGQLQRRRQALGDQFGYRPAVLVREPEIALRAVGGKASELHKEAVVQSQPLFQLFTFFERCVLADHVVDRITDIAKQRERNQRDGQHDHNRLHEPLCNEGKHEV